MNMLPRARSANIVVQPLGKEILVYDLNNHKAYNLNETSAAIYQACDGTTTFEDVKRRHRFTDDIIFLALGQLQADNLVESVEPVSPLAGMTRREAVRRVGLASLVALPLITTLVAPPAAAASSLTNLICTTPGGQVCAAFTDCNAYCSTVFNSSCTCVSNCCVECPNPLTVCNNVCTDTTTDSNNCGGCGNACPTGFICNSIIGGCTRPPA